LDNWSKIEFVFAKNLNINPLIMSDMEFWRVEKLIENYEDFLEEEKKQYDDQKKQQEQQYKNQNQPKVNYGGFKVPKVEIPKMNLPNM
jgi:sortase (surface protein transpeptidase)